jgi:hypothetical protein
MACVFKIRIEDKRNEEQKNASAITGPDYQYT